MKENKMLDSGRQATKLFDGSLFMDCPFHFVVILIFSFLFCVVKIEELVVVSIHLFLVIKHGYSL